MSEKLEQSKAESLSALMDGEHGAEAIDDLLKDEATQASWYRYQLVSSVMRKENSALSSFSFTEAVSGKIAEEPAILAPSGNDHNQTDSQNHSAKAKVYSIGHHWRRATGGLAVAASVAAAMVFSVQTTHLADSGIQDSQLASSSNSYVVPSKSEQAEQAELEAIQRLLMLRSEQAMRNGQDTILPEYEAVSGTQTQSYLISSEQWKEIEKQLKERQMQRQLQRQQKRQN